MRLKISWLLFGVLVALIIIILPLHSLFGLGGDLRNYLLPLGSIGALLAVSAATSGTGKWLRFFFALTGASASGWPVGLFMHDLLIKVWSTEPLTYILIFYILPVTFVTGIIGTIVTGIGRLIFRPRNK